MKCMHPLYSQLVGLALHFIPPYLAKVLWLPVALRIASTLLRGPLQSVGFGAAAVPAGIPSAFTSRRPSLSFKTQFKIPPQGSSVGNSAV